MRKTGFGLGWGWGLVYLSFPGAVSLCSASSRLELASWHHHGPSRFLSIVFEAQPAGRQSQNFPGKHLLSQTWVGEAGTEGWGSGQWTQVLRLLFLVFSGGPGFFGLPVCTRRAWRDGPGASSRLDLWLGSPLLPSACLLSHFSHIRLFMTIWTTPLSMGFSRQEYWSGLPCPPPRDLSDPGMEFVSLCLLRWQAGSLPLLPPGKPLLPSNGDQSRGQEWPRSVLLRQALAGAAGQVAPKGA